MSTARPEAGLKGKRVLVVGASGRGTGAATAAAVKRLGGEVILAARSRRGLAAAMEVAGEPVETVEFDMTDPDAVETAIASLGVLDHVAVTADPGRPGPFLEQPSPRRTASSRSSGATFTSRDLAPLGYDPGDHSCSARASPPWHRPAVARY